MIWNAFAIAVREIGRNLTRAFLTVLGIFIGVAAIITMVTLGQGATLAVKAQISSLGNNLLTLRPGAGFGSRAYSAGVPHFIRHRHDAGLFSNQQVESRGGPLHHGCRSSHRRGGMRDRQHCAHGTFRQRNSHRG